MKKSVVFLFVFLALVVLVSPAIVGRLAERSVDQQLEWAAAESEEVVVTAEEFKRGWFVSEGRHRVDIGTLIEDGGLGTFGTPANDVTLIIDTRLDHGLVPVSSMTREGGSLVPGLGNAISTVSVDLGDGEIVELPGTIKSRIALDGGLASEYVLTAGSSNNLSWGAGRVDIDADARRQTLVVDAAFEALSIVDDDATLNIGNFALATDLAETPYGYSVGDAELTIDSITVASPDGDVSIGPFTLNATSALAGEHVNATTDFGIAMRGVPAVGDMEILMDVSLYDADAAALGRLQATLDDLSGDEPPETMLALLENDLKDVLAAGLRLDFEQLDVTLPQGTVRTKLKIALPETARDGYAWTALLLDLEASADVRIPAALYEFVTTMNPDANAAVAMGILKADGDDYTMVAEYRKGLLTINGAPMPVPLPQ